MEDYRNKYLWMTPPYIFTVGILYLWGYWSSFEINVFEYAGFSDLIKVAIIPVGSVFIFTLIGFLLGEYTVIPISKTAGDERNDSVFKYFMVKTKWFWIIIYWSLLIFTILINHPEKWKILPLVAVGVPYFFLKKSKFLIELTNESVRSFLIISISMLPIFSFCQGKQNAYKIINNSQYMFTPSIAGLQHAKYLGHVAEYIFFISRDNSTIVFQKTTESPLLLIISSSDDKAKKADKTP